MKSLLFMVILLSGIIQDTAARQPGAKNTHPPIHTPGYLYCYYTDLGAGNVFRLDVFGGHRTLPRLNIDSIITEAVACIRNVEDSLAPADFSRKITINMYGQLAKEISIESFAQVVRNYWSTPAEEGFVKMVQDTVEMNIYPGLPNKADGEGFYRLSFFLNDLDQLTQFKKDAFSNFLENSHPKNHTAWSKNKAGIEFLKSNPSVQLLRGYDPDILTKAMLVNVGISLQSYNNYLIPSFSLAIGVSFEKNYLQQQIWIGYEGHLPSGRNDKGQKKRFYNEFVTLGYRIRNLHPVVKKFVLVVPNVSLGYLLQRKGSIYDEHTVRLGLGQFFIGGNSLRVEPTVYFRDFFKDATPGIRLSRSF